MRPEEESTGSKTNHKGAQNPLSRQKFPSSDRISKACLCRRDSAKQGNVTETAEAFLPFPNHCNHSNTRQLIFTAHEIKKREDVFIAGRGGETNFHVGNKRFRERVLEHFDTYAGLRTCDRGRKFARQLLGRYFLDVTFVVRHAYFFKNLQKGTLSKEKTESVREEHGGSFDSLHDLPTDHYFTVGETWILGIISDIIRFGGKASAKNKKRKTNTEFFLATVSDDESAASNGCRPKKRACQCRSVGIEPRPEALLSETQEASPYFERRIVDQEDLSYDMAEFESLVKMPLPSVEDEAFMFTDDELVLDFVDGAVPI